MTQSMTKLSITIKSATFSIMTKCITTLSITRKCMTERNGQWLYETQQKLRTFTNNFYKMLLL